MSSQHLMEELSAGVQCARILTDRNEVAAVIV
jgi:hypothetical protein